MNALSLVQTLQDLGYSVRNNKDELITVSLPLNCTLRLVIGEYGKRKISVYFGPLPRETSSLLMIVLYLSVTVPPLIGLAIPRIWTNVSDPRYYIIISALIIMSMIFEGYRYIITECALTRIENILARFQDVQKPANGDFARQLGS